MPHLSGDGGLLPRLVYTNKCADTTGAMRTSVATTCLHTSTDIKQYTHWWSFLPRQIILNISVGQYHRFRRVLTDVRAFILEVSIMLAKLVSLCAVPLALLWPKIRRLLNARETRYLHGIRPRRPAWIAGQIRKLLRYALRGPRNLKRLVTSTKQRRLQR